jgi:DNA repair protein RecN (Recombination protein N)
MLKHLLIENYALIEKLDIELEDGLSVITGETGAGKSILLGALALILGQRADTQVLMDKNRKCIIEGTFHVKDIPIRHLFEKYQLDYDTLSIFRREITPQGKSRAFINDTPVTLNVVTELAAQLIDIHSQHQNLLIGEASFQFDVLDSFSSNFEKVNQYRSKFREGQQMKNQLQKLEEQERQSRADLDYYRFQYEELEQARLNPEEYHELEEELEVLQHAEEIKVNLEKAAYLLDESEHNLTGSINEILQLIRPLGRYSEKFQGLQQRLESVMIEARDMAAEMGNLASGVVHDPEKAALLQQRLDLINKLLLKHNVAQVASLQNIREEYREKIEGIDSLETQIMQLRGTVEIHDKELLDAAREISLVRQAAIPAFEEQITGLLQQLGMPGGRFKVACTSREVLSANGLDQMEFFFTANVGGSLNPISRVASGGELSRLMLAVKSVISQKNLLPTIIFDEIDTGISGETGTRVANILQTIANNMQVITITHLPQIASRGKTHLLVYKTVENGKTQTRIRKIENQERITEIAKMLGGEKPSESMMETAKELIFNKVNPS